MAKRREHKKSRAGCRQCKARRIKCDENRPICKSCTRHGDDCDFTAFRLLRRYGTASMVRTESTPSPFSVSQPAVQSGQSLEAYMAALSCQTIHPPVPYLRSTNSSPSSRLFELRLLYNYMKLSTLIQKLQPQRTHLSLTMDSLAHIAFTSPVLMDALLGISALSLCTLQPRDPIFIIASHKYALLAICECSRQIRAGVNKSNAGVIFLASMLIAFHTFASRQHGGDHGAAGTGGGEMQCLQWFRLFQGVRAVKDAGRAWIQGYGGQVGLIFDSLPERFRTCIAADPQFFGFLLEGLDLEHSVDVETRVAYEDAITYLFHVRADAQLRGLLGFPIAVSSRFVDLLDGRDSTALLIVGNWLAMMRMSRLSGLLRGARERELDEIMQQLPQDWWPKMSWAMSVPLMDEELGRPDI